jgi:hypothetical protein
VETTVVRRSFSRERDNRRRTGTGTTITTIEQRRSTHPRMCGGYDDKNHHQQR